MWVSHNENPAGRNVGDCTVRAISAATGDGWDATYWGLCIQGAMQCNMPSADEVWGEYLRKKGWKRRYLPNDCPICYTVEDFCREYPRGVYIVGLEGHVVAVVDGQLLDTWDSRERHPHYYWTKEDRK